MKRVNSPIQFYGDDFGADARLCHPSKEGILLWCPPAAAAFDHVRLFPLRLQRFNRLGLCNPLGENQPSLSRRTKLFAMSPVGYGLSHFAVGDFPAFGRSQYLPLRPLTALCRRAISHRTRSLGVGSSGGHDRLER